eukprot:3276407-Pleurochrysis_carterae.AAC.2
MGKWASGHGGAAKDLKAAGPGAQVDKRMQTQAYHEESGLRGSEVRRTTEGIEERARNSCLRASPKRTPRPYKRACTQRASTPEFGNYAWRSRAETVNQSWSEEKRPRASISYGFMRDRDNVKARSMQGECEMKRLMWAEYEIHVRRIRDSCEANARCARACTATRGWSDNL